MCGKLFQYILYCFPRKIASPNRLEFSRCVHNPRVNNVKVRLLIRPSLSTDGKKYLLESNDVEADFFFDSVKYINRISSKYV